MAQCGSLRARRLRYVQYKRDKFLQSQVCCQPCGILSAKPCMSVTPSSFLLTVKVSTHTPIRFDKFSEIMATFHHYRYDHAQSRPRSSPCLASFPGRFVGEGKTAWSTLLTHARYSPQKQGNSCTFENPPLNSNVILRCMFAYHPFPLRGTLRYSRLLYCTVLYYTTSMEWSSEFL